MLCRVCLILSLLWSAAAMAVEITDATGRTMSVTDRTADRHPRVLYARGTDGLRVAAPDTQAAEVFTVLGWQVLAPDGPKRGQGTFRPSSIEAIRTLDPDIVIFSDPAMRDTLVRTEAWRTVRAVRDGNAHVAPTLAGVLPIKP